MVFEADQDVGIIFDNQIAKRNANVDEFDERRKFRASFGACGSHIVLIRLALAVFHMQIAIERIVVAAAMPLGSGIGEIAAIVPDQGTVDALALQIGDFLLAGCISIDAVEPHVCVI